MSAGPSLWQCPLAEAPLCFLSRPACGGCDPGWCGDCGGAGLCCSAGDSPAQEEATQTHELT